MIHTKEYTLENKIEQSEKPCESLSEFVSIQNSETDHLYTLNAENCNQSNNKNAKETPNHISNLDANQLLSDKD